ncbi:probable 28S ribosomal protein S16, mitochondrial [Uranotaenia lowii]|uniref:probable 28S ribosomal protein S16, mitochondrial n=1 Tax=Uranotaenia lowii TaxID=190385 RepID=UPI00247A488F|nr:probable 28S ribosomal protein S16, mitochondrial [Uranotaenia lowii]
MSLIPASGTGRFWARSAKIIRFARQGCTNRPFYHIVVMERRKDQYQPVIEQLGTYDPIPNEYNEKLASFNFERVRYWLGSGAHITSGVAELLGVAGLLPIHPRTYMTAWRNRQKAAKLEEMKNTEQKLEE